MSAKSNDKISKKQPLKYESFNENLIGSLTVDNIIYKIELKEKPECSKSCPAGVNVKAYVNLIANRRFEEAIEVIREKNPFPAICGRICTKPCEDNCEQGDKGDSVSIRSLKRYASDYELARRSLDLKPCKIIYDEKVAIIGAGPAGLSAAVDLIRMGYSVTVFESQNEPGGMLRYAIPSYRLPKRILKREIDWIKGLGIEIKTGIKISDPSSLFKKKYSAVLIAQGAQKSLTLGIEGEDAEGIIDPLEFLYKLNSNCPLDIKGNVVVIGGGSTAFDVARSAKRLGVKKVTIAYRRSFNEMPAEDEEIKDAQEEGVKILNLVTPKKINVKKGKVYSIEFLKNKLGKPDESGRRKPIIIKDSEFILKADFIIPAVGARPDIGPIKNLKITDEKGRIEIRKNGCTKVKGIYAAGDVQTGPSSVVEAIGKGHEAADFINSYLRDEKIGKKSKVFIPIVTKPKIYTKRKNVPERLEINQRIKSFDEVEKSYTDYEVIEEASRCLTCGPCDNCYICLPKCDYKQLVANFENKDFLLKVPCELSKIIYKKDSSKYNVKKDGVIKSINLRNLTAIVNKELCISCGRCEEVCAYRAIKNVIYKGNNPYAEVDHDSCASCSACISVCPTGAITQGYMSDEEILNRLENTKSCFNGIKCIVDYWSTQSIFFGMDDGIVEIMDARKLTPMFLIRALARSKKALLLIGPDEKSGSHYLPSEENPLVIVKRAKSLLKFVGISTDRIQYRTISINSNPSNLIEEFSKFIEKNKLKDLNIPIPKTIKCPIGEVITILRIMGSSPDIDNLKMSSSNRKSSDTIFFEGCLSMINQIGDTNKLFDLYQTKNSIKKLLEIAKINYKKIDGFSCPSKGLLDLELDGIKDIVLKIKNNNLKLFKSNNSKKLILGTPESYSTFLTEKDFGEKSSIIEELYKKLKKSKDFKSIKKTIAIHKACQMKKDPFLETTIQLLKLIPDLKIIEIKDKCGHNGFDKLNADSKDKALKLMSKASDSGASMIVCTSAYCQSHLLICQTKGSWRTENIEITDAFTLLLSSLEGDDIND